jgi:hypothetical protein
MKADGLYIVVSVNLFFALCFVFCVVLGFNTPAAYAHRSARLRRAESRR